MGPFSRLYVSCACCAVIVSIFPIGFILAPPRGNPMRNWLTGSVSIILALGLPSFVSAQTLTTSEASKHVGKKETVCGEIAGEHTAASSRGTPTFVNLDRPYPHQAFTVLIWGEDRAKIGEFPNSGPVCATGLISNYRGVPEIVVHDSHDWYVPK